MAKEEKQINWQEPTEERCYYIDLEFQGRIYVTKEMYNEYMKSTWSEWKRNERSTRCQVSNGRGGVKRCDKDCKECPHFRSGKSVSLDEVYEKYELEIADKSPSIIEKMVEEERNAALWKAVEELDPLDQKIMKLLSEGFSERDMAEALGIPRTTISYRKKISLDFLREKLKDFYY